MPHLAFQPGELADLVTTQTIAKYQITPRKVAGFLIFDSQFPRSIRHCIATAQICLHRINGSPTGSASNDAEKMLGRLKADIEYTDIDEVVDQGLHEYLDRLQTRLNQVDGAIGTTFFNLKPSIENGTQEQSQA